MARDSLEALAAAARAELVGNILPYWVKYARDEANGGFWGTLRADNTGDPAETRSVVMTSRHLWAYSAAARTLGDPAWLEAAHWAYAALTERFVDREFGGVFWSVKPDGAGDVTKKQIYGEAFAIYGLSEYAAALAEHAAKPVDPFEPLALALAIFDLLEAHARDPVSGGYVEARARDWSPTADLRLSDKDIDCEKSMNTNLHVMEAFTCLHRTLGALAGDDAGSGTVGETGSSTLAARGAASGLDPVGLSEARSRVGEALSSLVTVTMERILGEDAHLDLYFDATWKPIGDIVSYGHDIEASWLVWEAIEELEGASAQVSPSAHAVPAHPAAFADSPADGSTQPVPPPPGCAATFGRSEAFTESAGGLGARWREGVVRIARTALAEGFDPATGGLENETHGSRRDRTRIWWCQAEALVGFFNAWEMTGENAFLDAAQSVWRWIDRFQADRAGGDWFWAVGPDGKPDLLEPKGGNWKTPYHNARACMEIMRRAKA